MNEGQRIEYILGQSAYSIFYPLTKSIPFKSTLEIRQCSPQASNKIYSTFALGPEKFSLAEKLGLLRTMAAAMACSQLVAAAVAPSIAGANKSKFFGNSFGGAFPGNSNGSRIHMSAEWLPGQPRPAYLDGSAPGDFGFDPLGLGEVPENLERFKESELIHCRWAMLAIPGCLIPEALGLGNWVDAQKWAATPGGQATYLGTPVPWGNLPVIVAIEFVAIAFVESQRIYEPSTEKRKYPGGAFDPLGFSKDPKKLEEFKLKELKNGRLALLAFLGFVAQAAAYPGTGPLQNLASHLADPWRNNIANIVIPRSIL